MVLGLALIGWDNKMGAIFDFVYPKSSDLTVDMINKIYMTHAFKQDNISNVELIEINYDNQIILSYCDKTKVPKVGYEMVVLIIHQKEEIMIDKFKQELSGLAQVVIEKPKSERNQYLLENIEIFFKKTTEKKLLILGRAGTGKTSIKKVVFEGIDPRTLISNPLEPTRGLTPSVYSWLDLTLGIFDSAGQELDYLFENEGEQAMAFNNADIIIYLFDYPMWVSNQELIHSDVRNIQNIIKNKGYNANVILFLHKIDLINKHYRDEILSKIRTQIKNSLSLTLFFTSIYPELIYNTYNSFFKILGSFSIETHSLKHYLDEALKDQTKTMFFVTNKNHGIVAQEMSKDFDYHLINYTQKLVAQINQTFEEMCINDEIEYLFLNSTKELCVLMMYLGLPEFDLKNLICISETLKINELLARAHQIKIYYSDFYLKIKTKDVEES